MNLQEKTWPQIEEYLKSSKTVIIPVGSTEQHGPTGIIGIDYLTSESIARAVGERSSTLVTPSLCFGMAVHHMAFPGTISLSPATYIQVIKEIIQSLGSHGFKRMIFINGHGGNIAPLTSAFCEAKMSSEDYNLQLINWWHLPEVNSYESAAFGKENGFHATCGEISVTMFTHPDAYKDIKTQTFTPTAEKSHWPMSPQEYRSHFPDGRMGSNPALCSQNHGKEIFEIATKAILKKLEN